MVGENFISHGVRSLVGEARQRARADETRERREKQGQNTIDEALTTAAKLLHKYGVLTGHTGHDDGTDSLKYSVDPVPGDEFSLHLTGELRLKGEVHKETVSASAQIDIIFPESEEFPNGRTVQLFSLKGPLQLGSASESQLEVNGEQVTDPKLRIKYGEAMEFIAKNVRNRPQTPSVQTQV